MFGFSLKDGLRASIRTWDLPSTSILGLRLYCLNPEAIAWFHVVTVNAFVSQEEVPGLRPGCGCLSFHSRTEFKKLIPGKVTHCICVREVPGRRLYWISSVSPVECLNQTLNCATTTSLHYSLCSNSSTPRSVTPSLGDLQITKNCPIRDVSLAKCIEGLAEPFSGDWVPIITVISM